jgi:hypothetical protein
MASGRLVRTPTRCRDHVFRETRTGCRGPQTYLTCLSQFKTRAKLYRTFGAAKADARSVVTNAVLVMHGTGGTGAQFVGRNFAGELFGPGQRLDAAQYFIPSGRHDRATADRRPILIRRGATRRSLPRCSLLVPTMLADASTEPDTLGAQDNTHHLAFRSRDRADQQKRLIVELRSVLPRRTDQSVLQPFEGGGGLLRD